MQAAGRSRGVRHHRPPEGVEHWNFGWKAQDIDVSGDLRATTRAI